MKGTPGSVPPTTLPRGVETWAKYQIEGACKPRCGSLARSGLPVSLRAPDTTQLFDPIAPSTGEYAASSPAAVGDSSAQSALKSGNVHGGSPRYARTAYTRRLRPQ